MKERKRKRGRRREKERIVSRMDFPRVLSLFGEDIILDHKSLIWNSRTSHDERERAMYYTVRTREKERSIIFILEV